MGYRAPGTAPRPDAPAEALSCPAGARLPPEAERALAELEAELVLHGAPNPERTADWLAAGAPCPESVDDAFGAALDLLAALGRRGRA